MREKPRTILGVAAYVVESSKWCVQARSRAGEGLVLRATMTVAIALRR